VNHPPTTIAGTQPASNTQRSQSVEKEAIVCSVAATTGWYEPTKSALALVGLLAIALRLVKGIH
jgi:MYXO-CTERM domain-containing protein